MSLYNSNHGGIGLWATVGVGTIDIEHHYVLNAATIKGYYSRSEINSLLTTDVVGIRVYNVYVKEENSPEPKLNEGLVAVGIDTNGMETGGVYLQSPAPTATNRMATSITNPVGIVRGTNGSAVEQYCSFFSQVMLMSLLADENFAGINFYNSTLKDPSNPALIPINPALDTHIAIPANPNADGTLNPTPVRNVQDDWVHNMISDLPCPGHCVNETEDGLVATLFTTLQGPYLFSWTD